MKKNDFLTKIKTTSKYCLNLVSDFLDVSRLNHDSLKVELEEFDFVDLVNFVHETHKHELSEKYITLDIEKSDNEILVKADYGSLFQLVSNLIGNAIKYSSSDTVIKVKLSVEKERRSAQVNDSFLSLKVIDQGRGIP